MEYNQGPQSRKVYDRLEEIILIESLRSKQYGQIPVGGEGPIDGLQGPKPKPKSKEDIDAKRKQLLAKIKEDKKK